MTRRARSALAVAAVALLGCKRESAPAPSSEDAAPLPSASAASTAHPMAAPRCRAIDGARITPVGGSDAQDVEIGDAIAARSGFVIGLLRKSKGTDVGTVALVGADAKTATYVDLGPPSADAPPPKPFARNEGRDSVLVAFYGLPAAKTGKDARDLSLFDVGAGKAAPLGAITQQKDDSLAFDLVAGEKGGLVVWDEDEGATRAQAAHGVIKVATLSADARPQGAPKVISAPTTDAEQPRVALRRGGYWVAYLAHAPEPPPPARAAASAGSGADLEGPGSDRTFDWVELVAVDEQGAPLGVARRLTPDRGHVTDYELLPRLPSAPGKDAVDVVARDEGEATEGAGGRLLRVSARLDGSDPAAPIVSESVGAAKLELVKKGSTFFLFYGDAQDQVRAIPLGDAMAPLSPPSVEPALGAGRVLAGDGAGSILVESPGEAQGASALSLELASCDLPN